MASVETLNTESWAFMLDEYQRGKLRRTKLVRILRDTAHAPPPPEALGMIADVIEGTGESLQNGRDGKDVGGFIRHAIAREVAMVKDWIENPETLRQALRRQGEDDTLPEWIEEAHRRATYKHRKHVTARVQAEAIVAERHNVSISTVQHAAPKRRKESPDSLRKK